MPLADAGWRAAPGSPGGVEFTSGRIDPEGTGAETMLPEAWRGEGPACEVGAGVPGVVAEVGGCVVGAGVRAGVAAGAAAGAGAAGGAANTGAGAAAGALRWRLNRAR